ncbi:MAG: hypothetical protein R6U40_07790 [Desulfobacterales bacterium]
MQARAPLMIEHRLIERIIGIIKSTLSEIEKEETVDPVFVDTTVDFIRTYADRTHHGKEEDILFRELGKRDLSEEDLTNEIARIANLSLKKGYQIEDEKRVLTRDEAYEQISHSASLFKAILEYVEKVD